ncbi:MAG: dihydrofolate reductase family protein [Bacteroidota bacterium]
MDNHKQSQNRVFIATSLDGYIADKNGGIDYLHSIHNPQNDDMGYHQFMAATDALVMGRSTFETVCSFDIDWPYQKPVFVLSNSLASVPTEYEGKAMLVSGPLNKVLESVHEQGYRSLYIDGGKTIQSFLRADLIDELVITTIPILLGGGTSLFGTMDQQLQFQCVETRRYLDAVVQSRFVRAKDEGLSF